ncbi:hypothetical protein TNCT_521081 [Trichonephila clavata]|uniref:Uncharacterized protein n=1 Tax=Trichonephila clavata TaxID=2740835 RepID=A0A8X6HEE6_TRICU|nr:hypothetical protein TNCT_340141 [Trichonephila clavata]GFR24222.1 hypothetical protein TNCT_521081 [Trichonephila clavata]
MNLSAIKDLQLPLRSFARRIEINSDVADQLSQDLTNYICFSLQFDETTDVVDIFQRWILLRKTFKDIRIINNITSKEENMKCEDV